jgi:clan AA aspartic protease (TIGR02281 family)
MKNIVIHQFGRGSLLAVIALFAVAAAMPARGDALSEKGLKKAGAVYAIDEDTSLTKEMAALAEAKKKLATDAKGRRKIEGNIQEAKSFIGNAEFQIRQINEEMAKSADVGGQNRKIAQMNALSLKIKEAIQYRDQQEKDLAKLGDDARSQYITLILQLEKKVLKAEEKYAELAQDADVTGALEALKPKGKLGPTPQFVAASREIKTLRANVEAETIEVTMENEIPWVNVVFNGSTTRRMVFDTGASMLAIPSEMAKSMELVAPKDAPILHLQLADGKVVEAKQITLKSVRLGTFEAKDVEAAILPESLAAAQPLLGGSFMRHFIHKLDRGKGELHLARIGTEGNPVSKPAGGAKKEKETPAAPAPADKKPATDAPAEEKKEEAAKS